MKELHRNTHKSKNVQSNGDDSIFINAESGAYVGLGSCYNEAIEKPKPRNCKRHYSKQHKKNHKHQQRNHLIYQLQSQSQSSNASSLE